jgi:signal transduction histidine kinase
VQLFSRQSLSRQFLIASFPVFLVCALLIGSWVARKIENSVAYRIGGVTGMYVDSFLSPHVQSLVVANELSPSDKEGLRNALSSTLLGQRIVALKIWRRDGYILYSNFESIVGRTFPVGDGLTTALAGDVYSELSDLDEYENEFESTKFPQLIETYVPLHANNQGTVIAAAEFYHRTDELDRESLAARVTSWAVVLGSLALAYLLLFGLVRRGSATIEAQQAELGSRVQQLTSLNAQITRLHERVRGAVIRSATVHEGFLRSVATDLHDGPGQDMSLALMQLQSLGDAPTLCPQGTQIPLRSTPEYQSILSALQSSMADLRAISAGLPIPDISALSLVEVAARAVRDFEAKSSTKVAFHASGDLSDAPMPLRITLYRVLQESLGNSFRHGGEAGQTVDLRIDAGSLSVTVSDRGQGFDPRSETISGRMGLGGMRERVEMIGGSFGIESAPGKGTVVHVRLPLALNDLEVSPK